MMNTTHTPEERRALCAEIAVNLPPTDNDYVFAFHKVDDPDGRATLLGLFCYDREEVSQDCYRGYVKEAFGHFIFCANLCVVCRVAEGGASPGGTDLERIGNGHPYPCCLWLPTLRCPAADYPGVGANCCFL